MSRNSRRNNRRDREINFEALAQAEAILEAICDRRKLSYLLVFPEDSPIRLSVYHDQHEHVEKRTIPRHFSVEDLFHITDDLCDKWHKATTKH